MKNKFIFLSIGTVSLLTLSAAHGLNSQPAVDPGTPSIRQDAANVGKKKTAKKSQLAAPSASKNQSGSRASIGGSLKRSALPQSRALQTPEATRTRSIGTVKPPRSNSFYDAGTKEAEYEKLLDREINALFRASMKAKKSPQRGEIWLRLAERYVEKARLVEFRMQNEYDQAVKAFVEKKTRIKPRLDTNKTREHNKKAIQLYDWFVRDFPNDPKIDQALFFLGYNHFEMGNTKQGEDFYRQLVSRYPESIYVTESHFALGEFYFENEVWRQAFDNYQKVIQAKRARLASFAYYKAAWCLYRLSKTTDALKYLERVIRMSKAADAASNVPGRKSINRIRLAIEALKDYVPFYAEVGNVDQAYDDFVRVSGDERAATQMLEKLAYLTADQGSRQIAAKLFRQLISFNITGERAAEYQYQIVLTFATSDAREFRRQLEMWLENFGPASLWAQENRKNQKLVTDVARLQETTLRNHVLQLHQTAQNSRARFSQEVAHGAYMLYVKHFSDSPQIAEMQFFHAELLFDMGRFNDAARLYVYAADKDTKGQYKERAQLNAVLAFEKILPSDQEIEARRGKSLEKIQLDPAVEQFVRSAQRYITAFPKGEKVGDIERRLGVIYYSYNYFDEAIPIFEKTLYGDPASANGEIAGNLILDIYKLKDDMIGFADKGTQFMANPAIMKTKFGQQVRLLMEKANYAKAEKLAATGDHSKAAKEFENFVGITKSEDLALAARFKAAASYEKAGDLAGAAKNYQLVLATPGKDPRTKSLHNDARNALAKIYEQTGQLDLAAKQFAAYADANSKDQKAINGFFNAAVIWDGLGNTQEASSNYELYRKYSKRADRIDTYFLEAEMWQRRKLEKRAAQFFKLYLDSGGRDEAKRIEATFLIADTDRKAGAFTKSMKGYSSVLYMHKNGSPLVREATVKYLAEARFEIAQPLKNDLAAIRFGTSDKSQGAAAAQVQAGIKKYLEAMKEIIRLDYGPMIVAALASTGQVYDLVAQKFEKIPTPSGLAGEDAKKYRELIQVEVVRFKNEAKTSYQAAVDRSLEFETYGPWTKAARIGLSAYDAKFNDAGDLAVDVNAGDWMGL
ncbi:MAG: tetratricopeptide repeat protein [Deltaproteobacteria bacterium]|nr:tetratricopeptide repeat protein [Deltaproteobacteria bacterium]